MKQICNLNDKGIKRRRQMGIFFLVISFLYSLTVFSGVEGVMNFIILGSLLFGATIGFVQAQSKFCVYNYSTGANNNLMAVKYQRESEEDLSANYRNKFAMVIIGSAVIASVVTIGIYLINTNLF